MLNWAQSEVFNWAPAEYSIMIKLKGSPYYHDYVDQGTILDRVVGSSRVRNIENISVPLELTCFFGSKTLRQSFISSSKIFNSSIKWFFFSIWTAKISLRSILTTVRSRKRTIWSRKWKFRSQKWNFACEFFHLRASPFQRYRTYIPNHSCQ